MNNDDTDDLRRRFLRDFGDGRWHELEDLEHLYSLSPTAPLDPEALLQAIERGGIVIERGDVTVDYAPDLVGEEYGDGRIPMPGFRVVMKKRSGPAGDPIDGTE
jgi:hypothetical protein